MSSGVVRFSVSVDRKLLSEFDDTVEKLGHSRSGAVQMAMRDFVTNHKWTLSPEDHVTGAIVMIFEHDVRNILETLTHIQHHHVDAISSTTHIHLDAHNCLEIIAVKGKVKTIQKLSRQLITTRGVKQIKIAPLKQ